MLAVVSCQNETLCVGNVHNVSSTRVAYSSTSSRRTSIIEVKLLRELTLIFIYAPSLSHCVLTVISRCKFSKNGFFNSFFPLPHICHFETRPSPLSKIGQNAFSTHFLQLCGKKEYGDPHILFHDFKKNSAALQ